MWSPLGQSSGYFVGQLERGAQRISEVPASIVLGLDGEYMFPLEKLYIILYVPQYFLFHNKKRFFQH